MVGGRATVIVGTALMLRIAAFLIFSQPAGVLADRLDRKRILIAADVIRVLLLGVFPFIDRVWHIYVLIFLINAVTAFFTPTFEATIPEVVGQKGYTRAVALSRVSVDLEAALGPLLAGILIAAAGVRWAFWFDSLTYIASALLVWRSRVPNVAEKKPRGTAAEMLRELTHGTRIILREPDLRRALVLHMAEAIAGAVAIVTTVVYVRDVLHRGNVSFALAMTALGAGSSIAALTLARITRARRQAESGAGQHLDRHSQARRTLLFGGAALTLALLPGVLRPAYGVLLALWAFNGVGQALIAIPSVTLLADHTEPDERGRAYAAHFAWTHLFWLFTYPATGYMARALGTPLTFTIAGAACAILALVATAMPARHRQH